MRYYIVYPSGKLQSVTPSWYVKLFVWLFDLVIIEVPIDEDYSCLVSD